MFAPRYFPTRYFAVRYWPGPVAIILTPDPVTASWIVGSPSLILARLAIGDTRIVNDVIEKTIIVPEGVVVETVMIVNDVIEKTIVVPEITTERITAAVIEKTVPT